MTFDPTRPVQTRDGRPARILATDIKSDFPIVAAVVSRDGEHETIWVFHADGRAGEGLTQSVDLVNVQHARWVNFFRHLGVPGVIEPDRVMFKSKEDADRAAESYAREYPRVACVHVTWEE